MPKPRSKSRLVGIWGSLPLVPSGRASQRTQTGTPVIRGRFGERLGEIIRICATGEEGKARPRGSGCPQEEGCRGCQGKAWSPAPLPSHLHLGWWGAEKPICGFTRSRRLFLRRRRRKKPPSYSHCRRCQRDRLTRRREELGIYERCPPRAAARAQHRAGTRDAAILSLILSKITKELRWTANSQGSVRYSQTKTTPRRGAAGLGSERMVRSAAQPLLKMFAGASGLQQAQHAASSRMLETRK